MSHEDEIRDFEAILDLDLTEWQRAWLDFVLHGSSTFIHQPDGRLRRVDPRRVQRRPARGLSIDHYVLDEAAEFQRYRVRFNGADLNAGAISVGEFPDIQPNTRVPEDDPDILDQIDRAIEGWEQSWDAASWSPNLLKDEDVAATNARAAQAFASASGQASPAFFAGSGLEGEIVSVRTGGRRTAERVVRRVVGGRILCTHLLADGSVPGWSSITSHEEDEPCPTSRSDLRYIEYADPEWQQDEEQQPW